MISIYVHWPFCLAKCPYCDFNSHVAPAQDHALWLASYLRELNFFGDIFQGKYIKSIFFGGGTPSLMSPFTVEGILKKIGNIGKIDANTEITLEANPTSFEVDKFWDFKAAGINRVSIGVQALRDDDLLKLGRQHNASLARRAVENANKIFNRVSFDLIYARTGQTTKAWAEELNEAMGLASGHISLYQLTIEKGTAFYKLHKTGDLVIPSSEQAANMYELTNSTLQTNNYHRYEISNYARAQQECQHNLTYWHYDDYLGIGPGAHSRTTNILGEKEAIMMQHLPNKWLKQVKDQNHGMQSRNILTSKDAATEYLMMGMRLEKGINLAKLGGFVKDNLANFIDFEQIDRYQAMHLIELEEKTLKLTAKGLMLHNYLVPRLIKD